MINLQTARSLCEIAREAGERTLSLREQDKLSLQKKEDGSPVTRADIESQRIILEGLHALTPDVPVIAEEQEDAYTRKELSTYWLVDPLDGTRDFIRGANDFSVNMGLIVDGTPVFGIIFAPARDDLVCGGATCGVFRIKQGTLSHPSALPTPRTAHACSLTLSIRDAKKHPVQDWLDRGIVSKIMIHASAYKLALVAAREADLFLRTSVTYEWDTAAGDAIIRALGGQLMTPEGSPLSYQKRGLENGAFIASLNEGDRANAFLQASGLMWPCTQKTS